MTIRMYVALLLFLSASCFGQSVCPKHIETPTYPPVAAAARLQAKVIVRITLDAEGNVTKAEFANDLAHQVNPVLVKPAIENIKRWTFEKPPSAPVTQVIIYEYKMDASLPPVSDHQGPITKVLIDLPDHVTILHNESVADPASSRKKPKSSAP